MQAQQQQSNEFSHLAVSFSLDPVENKQETLKEGRPIFDEVEHITIRIAGDSKSVFVAPAHQRTNTRDRDTGRYLTYAELHSGPYQAFKDRVEYVGSGTPLSEVPFISVSKARELSALNVRTVEALAGLDGTLLGRLGMGARDLKTQAEAWLDSASGNKDIQELQEQNKKLQEQMDQLLSDKSLRGAGAEAEDGPEDEDATPSLFEGFERDDLVNYITDQTGDAPHHKTGEKKLLEMAEDIAKKLREE